MKLLPSIPILFLALAVQATDVTFPFYDLVQSADFFSASTNVVMRIKYNDAPTVYNGRIILKDWRSWTNDPSGSTTITNLVPGRHLVTLTARNSETSFTINVPDTNVTISAATITVTATNSVSGTGTAYSQASSDARFQAKTNGISSSEIADGLIATNRLRVKVTNGASPSAGMVLTAIDTNGTAVWSNAPAGVGGGSSQNSFTNGALYGTVSHYRDPVLGVEDFRLYYPDANHLEFDDVVNDTFVYIYNRTNQTLSVPSVSAASVTAANGAANMVPVWDGNKKFVSSGVDASYLALINGLTDVAQDQLDALSDRVSTLESSGGGGTNYDVLNIGTLNVTNALGVASGGTGKTNVTAGRMLSGNGTNALDEVIIGSGLSLSGSTGSTRTLTASGGGSGGASYWDTNTSGNITNTGNRKVLINGGIHSAAIFDPDYSLVMGDNAGANAHGSFSVMLGVEAGRYSDQANGGLNGQNVLIGYQAGEFSQAYASTFIGWSAGKACLDAVSQVGVGYGAHQNAVNSSGSVAVGVHAGESIQNSSDSVVAGYHAAGSLGWSNNTGVVAIGGHAAEAWHDSYYGIAIGNYAGNSVTNAAGSIYIGPFTGTNRASTLVIEGSATAVNQNVGGSGALIYGEFDNRRLTFNGTAKVGNTNGSLVAASAAFEVDSTTKGLLLPRMTKTQRDAIGSPAAGLMVYQTDNTPGLRVYNGTSWMRFTETAD
jgi:hypothetical protein